MASIGAEARRRTVSRRAACSVAVIAGRGRGENVAEVLRRQGFDPTSFTDAGALLRDSPAPAASVIVLWVEDAADELAAGVESLTGSLSETPIVVVCESIERWDVRAALAAGASGVVLSGDLESALGPCIHAALAGQTCVPRGHWRQIDPPALSAREKQILGLVVMGYMNSQIAKQLFLAESTVKSHLSSAYIKLGVRSRKDAAAAILDPNSGFGTGILAISDSLR